MKRNAIRDDRVRRAGAAGGLRGNTPTESLAVTALVGGALVLGVLLVREQHRSVNVAQLDHAAIGSSTVQWVAAGVICAFALGCVIAVLRHVPHAEGRDDASQPPAELAHAFELLSDPATELGRVFGAGHRIGHDRPHPRDASARARPFEAPGPHRVPPPMRR